LEIRAHHSPSIGDILQTIFGLNDGDEDPNLIESWKNFIQAEIRAKASRVTLRTTKYFLGLGAIPARHGDQMRLFWGATVPFMLRPVKPSSEPKPLLERQHFQLVEDCYLRGFMLESRWQMLEGMTEIAII
jgi:hypothetical protein